MGTNILRFIKKTTNIVKCGPTHFIRTLNYVQGQQQKPKVREYFYYIDHEGMVSDFDDAKMKNFTSCFKETKFLKFFFKRIKLNETDRYREEFPFISPCGREKNYIRCDDLPIVFTHVLSRSDGNVLSYAHAGDQLITPFQPDKIYMKPDSGRVYHPAWPEVGGIGLIRSKLALELAKYFEFEKGEDNPPTHFTWNGQRIQLNNDWIKCTIVGDRNK